MISTMPSINFGTPKKLRNISLNELLIFFNFVKLDKFSFGRDSKFMKSESRLIGRDPMN